MAFLQHITGAILAAFLQDNYDFIAYDFEMFFLI